MPENIKSFKISNQKPYSELGDEWNLLADLRYEQLSGDRDVTFSRLICPHILDFLLKEKPKTVLDIGCGTGILSNTIARCGIKTVGIDISSRSIEIAAKTAHENATFDVKSLEEYVRNDAQTFGAAVANMVLMNVYDLLPFLLAVNRSIDLGSCFVYSITHPCFWPQFCGYDSELWHSYSQRESIEGPFMISSEPDKVGRSTHVHRPLADYLNSFFRAGFVSEILLEPMPSDDIKKLYPYTWRHPRYIIGLLRKISEPKYAI